ncbi:hypothetical protein HRbin30_00383 [bacterium HR30]|nr:hypothetical protein HRbin30_00383 [bacterium HR30]
MAGAAVRGLVSSPWVRFLVALLGLAVALWGRFLIPSPALERLGTWLLVLGCVAAAIVIGAPAAPSSGQLATEAGPTRGRIPVLLASLLLVAGFAAFGYASWSLIVAWRANFDWAAPLMVGAVALATTGLAILDRKWRQPLVRVPTSKLELFLVLVVLACGTFLRFYRIDYFPPTDGFVAIEEPQSGQGAWAIMAEGVRPWEFLLDRWLAVPFFHWVGISILALRIPFVIVSCLTLLATYILAREVVRWPAALLATALLAVSHWHLHYARLAHNIFPTTLLSVVVWWLCIRQARTGGLRLYPWIGFWSGYSLYAYAGYRGIPIVVGVFLFGYTLYLWWHRNDAPTLRQTWRLHLAGLLLFVLFFSGPVAALVNQLRSDPSYFLEAFYRSYANKQYYVSDWPTWLRLRWERILETSRIFHHVGDREQAYNLPGEPMLDPVSGVLFTTALVFCLVYPRHRFQGFFAFAFLFLLLAGALLTQTLVVARLQIVVPLVFVLVALWADRMWELSGSVGRQWVRSLWGACTVAAVVAAAVLNWNVYFGKMIHSPVMRAVYRNYYTTAITFLHSLPDNAYALLLSDMRNLFIPNDYAWWRGNRVPGEVTIDIYPLLTGAKAPWEGRFLHLLIQRPFEQQEIAELVRWLYPEATCEWIRHPEGYPHLDQIACTIGRDVRPKPARFTLRARYFRPNKQEPFLERAEPALSWALFPEACSRWHQPERADCIVEWDGTFVLQGDSRHELAVEARNAHVEGDVDGREFTTDRSVPIEGYVLGGEMRAARLVLDPGTHRIRVRARPLGNEGDPGVRLRRKDPVGGWQLVTFLESEQDLPSAGELQGKSSATVEKAKHSSGELAAGGPVEP